MDSQDVLVLAANNLRLGPDGGGSGNALEVGASRATTGQRSDELPKSVIVTNVGLSVFDDEQTKVRNVNCIQGSFISSWGRSVIFAQKDTDLLIDPDLGS